MKILFTLLISLCLIFSASADSSKWEKDIAAFEKADAENPPPKSAILFVGSSSIRMWKTLAADFPEHKVINRGFGGSQMEDSVTFYDRIVAPYEPSMIVIYAGANDINAKKTPQRVLEDTKAFVAKVHAKQPGVTVAFIAISPNPARWSQIENVREANRLVADYAKATAHVEFINTFDAMLGEDGMPKPDIFIADKLHMNEKGYAIWRDIIGKALPKP